MKQQTNQERQKDNKTLKEIIVDKSEISSCLGNDFTRNCEEF